MQYSIVQYSIVQNVQYSIVQYSIVQCSIVYVVQNVLYAVYDLLISIVQDFDFNCFTYVNKIHLFIYLYSRSLPELFS